jgi:hypothetical protein
MHAATDRAGAWQTNNLDFHSRYMVGTREYPRDDLVIEIEQRPGGDDEDQATVWDCARTCSAWFSGDAFAEDYWRGALECAHSEIAASAMHRTAVSEK